MCEKEGIYCQVIENVKKKKKRRWSPLLQAVAKKK
jgi:hypothetical protein